MKRVFQVLVVICSAVVLAVPAFAQKPGERPPSPVVTGKVTSGDMAPQTEFIGTVYFTEISNVAAEVEGKLVSLNVEDGQRVRKGDPLVVLSSDILDRSIANARALMDQAQADFELAKRDNERTTKLYNSRTVAEGEYDSKRLAALSSEKKMIAARAILNRLQIEREKKTIRSPYDGVVLERKAFRGEWVSTGSVVAVVARDDEFDVVVNAPREAFGVVKPGLEVVINVAGREIPGKVFAAIPKGDVATRTFPVKIRVANDGFLAEGMEARVVLPEGLGGTTLIVPRDAIISSRGQMVVWAVIDGKAVPMSIYVVGYRGMEAGVKSKELREGMDVVVKGNERLQPQQPVAAQPMQP
ncbi:MULTISPECIES: efflux RND transporter periplasmic adaptor subunit [unclassified Pseudodesulfovibrio]|uniref:efflux RND transporter periplasmic adaptor subunit n=1 Tax=unclassified Pseudodesulfovibrio TaxID=2661612 RepID=UPI000FEBB033|nr:MULTISPECIES: efflux RND transporter periplasmic adaptor subunit [unclassified Pseudodesulfovibrio]MCJ2166085.1 efflux RND transporter periplasmic adaptor subunit [Pseudodesulfovibrio sp. S3-i]RWU02437.1 efflux RND transporter periplasmic adaptor subunit [Pseudodesulfovibrio sp. S3]